MKTKLIGFLFVFCAQAWSQSYPFDLPERVTASINVSTTDEEPFNNLLLGTNTHDLAHADGQELVRDMDPVTIRFPHGLFSNWYDWEQDKARLYGEDNVTYTKADGSTRTVEVSYLSSIKTMDNSNILVGINGLNVLNNEKKTATGKGYDMMWTFNMSADGTDFNNGCPVSVARYQDLKRRGFEVKAIEMGNENFYAGQRSSIIPNHSDYIARAKSMYAALKALDPDLKLSVNLERKSNPANVGWNTDLTNAGTDYFDAVSVHTYVGYDPDDNNDSNEAYSVALTAREVLRKTIDNYSRVVAPDKPIWLTEWGVKSGGPNAVSALGMADCYMFMSENQEVYERANWFSVNGKLNSHLVWETVNGKAVIKEPLEKTSFGSTYEIVRSVYENSTMLGSETLTPTLDGVVNAVNARAVKKDGKTLIFVLNMTDQEVPFSINLDGQRFFGEFEHKTFAFSAIDAENTLPFYTDPLTLVKAGRGSINLPKFSINTIELKDKETLSLDFVNLAHGDQIDKGSDLTVSANVGEEFEKVSLYVDDSLMSTIVSAPYVWSDFSPLKQMMELSYSLKLVGEMNDGTLVEREINISTPEQWAYTNDYKPHPIPGIIQVEHYDYGGENVAFYDKGAPSASYTYRGDDNVDLGSNGEWLKWIQGKEWLEYSVEVKRTGTYDLAVKHQTRRSPEFEAMSFLFQESGQSLFAGLKLTNSDGAAYTIDTMSSAFLNQGRNILRLDILGYGYDMDYFEFILTSNPVDYFNVGTLSHDANPQSYDSGNTVNSLLPPLDSVGFDFAGWFTNAACTDTVSVPAIASDDDGAKAFYARWTPKSLSGDLLVYGDVVEGSVLRVDTSRVKDYSERLMFQWQKSAGDVFVDIVGANSPSYTLQSAEVGTQLRVLVKSRMQLGTLLSPATNVILSSEAETYTITYDANGGQDGDFTMEILGMGGHPTFIAQPYYEGYAVVAWTNADGDTLTELSVINSDTTLYAQWSVQNRFVISFKTGSETIDVLTDRYPAVIPYLPQVLLQEDSVFQYWQTAAGERIDTSYLVFDDLEVYPVWQVKRFPINVSSSGGTVLFEPQQSTYEIHSQVKLTVVPSARYDFISWGGDYESTDTTITILVDSMIDLYVDYIRKPYYALDVFFAYGDVVKYPNSSMYISGSEVVLTATPAPGYEFDKWSGSYEGTENPLTIKVTEKMELFANFVLASTALDEQQLKPCLVFPNPSSSGVFHLEQEEQWQLYSSLGHLLSSGHGTVIDVSDMEHGVYFLRLNQHVQCLIFQ